MIREPILFRPFFSLLLLLSFSPFCTYEPTSQIHPSNASTHKTLQIIPGDWNQVTIAKSIMEGAKSYQDASNVKAWNFTPSDKNEDILAGTWWTMGYVSRAMTDKYITEQVADILDKLAEQMVDGDKVVEGATWDYTVSVAKADSLAGNDADRSRVYLRSRLICAKWRK